MSERSGFNIHFFVRDAVIWASVRKDLKELLGPRGGSLCRSADVGFDSLTHF